MNSVSAVFEWYMIAASRSKKLQKKTQYFWLVLIILFVAVNVVQIERGQLLFTTYWTIVFT